MCASAIYILLVTFVPSIHPCLKRGASVKYHWISLTSQTLSVPLAPTSFSIRIQYVIDTAMETERVWLLRLYTNKKSQVGKILAMKTVLSEMVQKTLKQ